MITPTRAEAGRGPGAWCRQMGLGGWWGQIKETGLEEAKGRVGTGVCQLQ